MEMRSLHGRLPAQALAFFAEVPTLYHCHHFNLFLDQTIDDALGPVRGEAVRRDAAHESAYQLLCAVVQATGASTAVERASLAEAVFSWMGHGVLRVDAEQGTAHGSFLHYGFSWREKYGRDIKRRRPADGFAAGYVAAAIEVVRDVPLWSLDAREEACVSMRSERCEFRAHPRLEPPESALPHVDQAATSRLSKPPQVGQDDPTIEAIEADLLTLLDDVQADRRGLVQAFGVFITQHLAGYYNRVSYTAVELLRRANPPLVPILESLLRESGQVCAFHTFGGILLSPEWEAMVGAPTGDVHTHVVGCMAIARALGFGRWTLQDLDPARRLVVRTAETYETPYHLLRHGQASAPSSYFLQGAGLAFMELAHRVAWTEQPQLDDTLYRRLFTAGAQWRVEQTADTAMGDDYCEVVVTRR